MRKDLDLSFELICTMRAFGCPVSEMFRTEFVAVASHVWSCFSHWASISVRPDSRSRENSMPQWSLWGGSLSGTRLQESVHIGWISEQRRSSIFSRQIRPSSVQLCISGFSVYIYIYMV